MDILHTLDKILNLIEERGLKQQAILKEFGYDKSFFSDWKAGKIKNPPIEKIIKFAEYFSVSTDYLLGLSEQKRGYEKINESENGKEDNRMAVIKKKKEMIEALENLKESITPFKKMSNLQISGMETMLNMEAGAIQNLLDMEPTIDEELSFIAKDSTSETTAGLIVEGLLNRAKLKKDSKSISEMMLNNGNSALSVNEEEQIKMKEIAKEAFLEMLKPYMKDIEPSKDNSFDKEN